MRALAGFVIAALLLILPACGGGASPGPVPVAPAATSAPSPAATSAPMETKDTDYGY